MGAVLLAGLMTALAACGGSPASSSKSGSTAPGASGAQEQTTVTLTLSGWSSSPAELKIVQDQIAAFEKLHPDIKVQWQPVPGDYMQKIQTEIASHTEPDVFYLDSSVAYDLMSQGAIQPLDPYVAKYKTDLSRFVPNLLKAFQYQGKTYGFPKGFSTLALVYNTRLFQQAGIGQPPKSWAELEADARQLTRNGVEGLVMDPDFARLGALVEQAGGTLVDSQGKAQLDSPSAIEAAAFYQKLVREGVLKQSKDVGAQWAGDALAKGKAAMVFEGNWVVAALRQESPDLRWSVAPLPQGKQAGSLAFTVAYVMGKDTKHPEAAYQLIDFLTGPQGEKFTEQGGLEMPSVESMLSTFSQDYPEQKAFAEAASYALPWQLGPNGQTVIDAVNKALQSIYLQGADPKQALQQAQASIHQ
ncbi:MAG: ABC transporter substrate-binding protein [Bacillota bacterium]|nr:ABC transporter substrate-binding protein [Bacillota bacterium]